MEHDRYMDLHCTPLPGLFDKLVFKKYEKYKYAINADTSHWKEILISWHSTWVVGALAYCMS